jgi:hypothetical protein
VDININGETVVSEVVPAGTYSITATIQITNFDIDTHQARCDLVVNGTSAYFALATTLPAGLSYTPTEMSEQTFTGDSNTIAVACNTPQGVADAAVTALPVG